MIENNVTAKAATINFKRAGMEDFVFEPFGEHASTQREPAQEGDVFVSTGRNEIRIPYRLIAMHSAWSRQPEWLKKWTFFAHEYSLLDETDKKEIDTILKMFSQEINRRAQINRRKRKDP